MGDRMKTLACSFIGMGLGIVLSLSAQAAGKEGDLTACAAKLDLISKAMDEAEASSNGKLQACIPAGKNVSSISSMQEGLKSISSRYAKSYATYAEQLAQLEKIGNASKGKDGCDKGILKKMSQLHNLVMENRLSMGNAHGDLEYYGKNFSEGYGNPGFFKRLAMRRNSFCADTEKSVESIKKLFADAEKECGTPFGHCAIGDLCSGIEGLQKSLVYPISKCKAVMSPEEAQAFSNELETSVRGNSAQ